MKHPVLLCLFVLLCTCVCAQPGTATGGGVSGQLLDEATGEPIGFANVAVYSGADSLIAGGTTDLDGRFELTGIPYGRYRVEMSFLGYGTRDMEVELSAAQPAVAFDNVTLGEGGQDLEEVVVTADRAVMELGLDRKVFNVEKSIAAAGGSAEDLLRQIPSITVDLEGNVSLRGTGNVRFLVNGRPSGLTGTNTVTFLQSLTAANIERVEVITNPGAAYDPDGTGGIINIVLKNKQDDGFNAGVTLNAGTGNKIDGNLDANWRKGKFNTTFGVSARHDERFFRGYRDQTATFPDTTFSRFFTFNGSRQRESQALKLGVEYFLSKRGSLQLSGNYQWDQGNSTNLRTTKFYDGKGALASTGLLTEAEPETGSDYEFRADYRTTFAKDGRQLSGSLQFSNSEETETGNFFTNTYVDEAVVSQDRRNSPSNDGRRQYLGQLDYEQQIGEFKFEAGWRSTLQQLENESLFNVYNFDADQFERVDSNSNRFLYNEDVHAVYATFGGKVDKLIFSAGLRAEQAYTNSQLTEPTAEDFTNDYLKVYPSVFLGYQVSETGTLQASYSRRINRPDARALNPFVDRGDPLNLRTGNPFLLPELINSFELNLQQQFGKGTVTGGFYFRQLSDLITRITETRPGGISVATQANLDSGRDYGVEIITTYRPTKKMDLTVSANAYKSIVDGTLAEGAVEAAGYMFNGRLQGTYAFPWGIGSQFTYFYRSPGVTPQGKNQAMQSLDLGLRKPILNDLGAITLRVTDLFNQRKFGYTTDVGGLLTSSQFQRESRIVYLGFQYSLRPQQNKARREQQQSRDDGGGGEF